MKSSDSIAKLAGAFVKAQAKVDIAIKNAVNPHLKNKYADLGAVWDAVAPALEENELSVLQLPAPAEDGKLHLETMLLHSSGEWISNELVMPLTKADPQGYGAALTYARRYALAALMGVTQDDDDGERAVTRRLEVDNEPSTDLQRKTLANLLKTYGRTWEQLAAVILSGKYKDSEIQDVSCGDIAAMIKFVEGRLHAAKNESAAAQ